MHLYNNIVKNFNTNRLLWDSGSVFWRIPFGEVGVPICWFAQHNTRKYRIYIIYHASAFYIALLCIREPVWYTCNFWWVNYFVVLQTKHNWVILFSIVYFLCHIIHPACSTQWPPPTPKRTIFSKRVARTFSCCVLHVWTQNFMSKPDPLTLSEVHMWKRVTCPWTKHWSPMV